MKIACPLCRKAPLFFELDWYCPQPGCGFVGQANLYPPPEGSSFCDCGLLLAWMRGVWWCPVCRKYKDEDGNLMNFTALVNELEDQFGPAVDPRVNYWLPTGSTLIDAALRGTRVEINGGLPGGTVTEAAGEEQSGKTSWAMMVCANAIAQGGNVIWADAEGRFDDTLADLVGLPYQSASFTLRRPECLEEFLGGAAAAFEAKLDDDKKARAKGKKMASTPFVVVLDSLADLAPRKISLADMGDKDYKQLPLLIASLWSDFFRKAVMRRLSGTNCYLILLNQARTAINFFAYGPPDMRSPGGYSLRHKCTNRLRFSQDELHPNDKRGQRKFAPIGMLTHIKLLKTGGPPKRHVWIPFLYHFGYDDALSCLNFLIGLGHLRKGDKKTKTTGKIWYGNEARSKREWRAEFYRNPEFAESIRQMARDAFHEEFTYRDQMTETGGDEVVLDDDEGDGGE